MGSGRNQKVEKFLVLKNFLKQNFFDFLTLYQINTITPIKNNKKTQNIEKY